jgi:hypothetical protein
MRDVDDLYSIGMKDEEKPIISVGGQEVYFAVSGDMEQAGAGSYVLVLLPMPQALTPGIDLSAIAVFQGPELPVCGTTKLDLHDGSRCRVKWSPLYYVRPIVGADMGFTTVRRSLVLANLQKKVTSVQSIRLREQHLRRRFLARVDVLPRRSRLREGDAADGGLGFVLDSLFDVAVRLEVAADEAAVLFED